MEQALVARLPEAWDLSFRDYTRALSVVEIEGEGIKYGFVDAEHLHKQPSDLKKIKDGLASRAAGKLEETLAVLGLPLGAAAKAIDLGSAPGAWTALLAGHVGHVVAVDPAEMDPAVLALGNVEHMRMKAEDAVSALLGQGTFQLVVSDMNMHIKQCAEVARPLLPLLESGGHLIMTVKGFGRGRDKEHATKDFIDILGESNFRGGAAGIKSLWLIANTVCERTLIAVKS
mmetsp:Transcript_16526/g.51784  ORF Transcript_16526/g.51784 Transcript_16526/m.51784 type:complete len:230 (+) Transcript_16526:40-729(+)